MTTSTDIINFAKSQIGVKWVHQGRSVGRALDCAGLVVCAHKHLGLPCGDLAGYSLQPDGVTLKRLLDQYMVPMGDLELEPGRVAVFWMRKATKAWQHLGIIVPGGRMVHGHTRRDRIIENMISGAWAPRLVATYRFNGVTY